VHGDRGEVALDQQLVELYGSGHGPDEDDDLVEDEGVQQVVQLAVLLVLGQLDEVLLEAVEGQLGLVVDNDLKRLQVVR
jgi:hypothetical protein